MAVDFHVDAAYLRLLVAFYGLLEGLPPLFRNGLPFDLTVHIIAVTPSAVEAARLIGKGRKCAHPRVLLRHLYRYSQQMEVTLPVHEILVERA